MILAATLLLTGSTGPPSCRTADARVENVISAKAAELKGEEYCQYRLYRTLDDVDGDGVEDFVVVFGVERGANDVVQFLAVFQSRDNWAVAVEPVGHRWDHLVESLDVEHGVMVLKTMDYRKGDAGCCPSGHGALHFILQGGRLVERTSRPTTGIWTPPSRETLVSSS